MIGRWWSELQARVTPAMRSASEMSPERATACISALLPDYINLDNFPPAGRLYIAEQQQYRYRRKGDERDVHLLSLWLPCPDSNQEMRHQKPLCYHYTTRQSYVIWTACRHKCGAKLLLFFDLQPFSRFFLHGWHSYAPMPLKKLSDFAA